MIKKLIACLLTLSLVCNAQYLWYPKDYNLYAGNSHTTISTDPVNGGTVAILIKDLPQGYYSSISLRNSFRLLPNRMFPACNWQVEVAISFGTRNPEDMIDINSHNLLDYRIAMLSKNINLPLTYPRLPNGGIDAIIGDYITTELIFDTPVYNPSNQNACITLFTTGMLQPHRFFDTVISIPMTDTVLGSKSIFRDSQCSSLQFEFEEEVNVIRQGNSTLLRASYLLEADECFVTVSAGIATTPTPIDHGELHCLSYIDYSKSIVYIGNHISEPIPNAVTASRLPFTVQVTANHGNSTYFGPTWVLCCPPSTSAPRESRMMSSFGYSGPTVWNELFFVLKN